MPERTETALVLQGCGASGAYQIGVVARLAAAGIAPDIVTGVSIGAVNGALLVGAQFGDGATALREMWQDFTIRAPFLNEQTGRAISSVTNFGMYRPRYDLWGLPRWTTLLSTDPLRSTLARHVDFNELNESPIAFATSAANVATGTIETFSNRSGGYISIDDIVASASLPPGFPMTEIDGTSYWDAGLFMPAPLQPALDLFSDAPGRRRRLIVVGTGARIGKVPANYGEVLERMIGMIFEERLRSDLTRVRALAATGRKERASARAPDEIVMIPAGEPQIAISAADFSESTVQRLIDAGMADTDAALAAKQDTS